MRSLGQSFTLNTNLNLINLGAGGNLQINGNGFTIDGGGAWRGLTVYSGTVTLNQLALQNMVAQGGAGGNATNPGGGGAGLGGGLLVASGGNVTLNSVTFFGDSAVGGRGGSYQSTGFAGGGGGGGFGGGAGGYANNNRTGGVGGGGAGGFYYKGLPVSAAETVPADPAPMAAAAAAWRLAATFSFSRAAR